MFKPFVYVRTSRNIQIIVSDIQYRPAYEKCVNRLTLYLNPNCISGGGDIGKCDAKICEKCLRSHHNNTALIVKKISLFGLSHDK